MPKGLVVVRWDDRIGTVIEASYPPKIHEITPDITMKIYGTHTLGKDVPTPDFVVAKVENLNIASFYGGLSIQHFVLLLLDPSEQSELYEDPLMEISYKVFENIQGKKYKENLEELFEYLKRYSLMNEEQKLALFISDPNRYAIIARLVDEGSITKNELAEYVKKMTGRAVEIDVSLAQLVKFGLVSTEWVEGLSSECAFLTRDVFPIRRPAMNIIEKAHKGAVPKDIASKYLDEVKEFFTKYAQKINGTLEWLDQDAPLVLWAIKDIVVSDIVALLKNEIVSPEYLAKQIKAPAKDVSRALSELLNGEFATVLPDGKGHDFVMLVAEPRILSTFPDHIVTTVVENYNNGLMPAAQVSRYLNILKDSHPRGGNR